MFNLTIIITKRRWLVVCVDALCSVKGYVTVLILSVNMNATNCMTKAAARCSSPA